MSSLSHVARVMSQVVRIPILAPSPEALMIAKEVVKQKEGGELRILALEIIRWNSIRIQRKTTRSRSVQSYSD